MLYLIQQSVILNILYCLSESLQYIITMHMDMGSQQNPIQILEEDEQLRHNQEKIQYQRNRQALYQAHMGSQFDVLVAVIKEGIKGSDQEKNRILKSRIVKFFNHGSKSINVQTQNFRPKREADYSDPSTIPVTTQLILYGVDFLGAKQIKRKFTGLNTEVQWLDDSHCRVRFESAEDAKKGLQMNLKNKKQGMVKLQDEQIQVPKGWFQLLPYFYLTLERRLLGRYAASNEHEAQIQKSNDYYLYQEAKKKFEENIAQQVTSQKYFEVMRKYHLVGENKAREKINMYRRQRNNYQYDNRNRDRNQDRDREGFRNRAANHYRRGGYNQDNNNNYRNDGRDYPGNGRYGRKQFNQNNRYNNRNNQQVQNQMQRSRQKYSRNQQQDLDNLSLISRPVSHLPSNHSQRQPRQRKFSISQCSNPIQRKEKQDDNLSFILNQSQINSQQILVHFNNLSLLGQQLDSPEERGNDFKQQQANDLSIVSGNESGMSKNRGRGRANHHDQQARNQINTSFNLNESVIMSKNKGGNTSVLLDQSKVRDKEDKANCSIEQITIYD